MTEIPFNLTNKLHDLIIAGGLTSVKFTNEEILWLKKTIKVPIKLYRGIGYMPQRTNKDLWNKIDRLKLGDNLPKFLQKSYIFNNYASYTKKKSVADYYSDGRVSIIVEKVFNNKNKILVDFFNLTKIIPESQFIKDHLSYFQEDKEVIVFEPVNELKIIKKRDFLSI